MQIFLSYTALIRTNNFEMSICRLFDFNAISNQLEKRRLKVCLRIFLLLLASSFKADAELSDFLLFYWHSVPDGPIAFSLNLTVKYSANLKNLNQLSVNFNVDFTYWYPLINRYFHKIEILYILFFQLSYQYSFSKK